MLTFQRLNDPLFDMVGLIRGRLIDEEAAAYPVYTFQDVVEALVEMRVAETYPPEELETVREQLRAMSSTEPTASNGHVLASNSVKLVEVFAQFELPDDVEMEGLSFQSCTSCQSPLTHGHFRRYNRHITSGGMWASTLTEMAVFFILGQVQERQFLPLQGIALIKQVVDVGLCFDEVAFHAKTMELATEEMRKVQQAGAQPATEEPSPDAVPPAE